MPVLFGNCLETYDFCLYGFLAPTFAVLFFPENLDKSLSIIFAFGVFLVAYISRPLGILIWGHIADKYGRKPVLIGTLSMMAIPAIGMACVPVYNDIGFWATALILIFRILQGIAFGGEMPTIIVTLYELAPKKRQGLYTSLADTIGNVGTISSILIIIFLSAILSHEQFISWGWRMPFMLSIVAIFVIGYTRLNVPETLTNNQKHTQFPALKTIQDNWKSVLKITLYLSPSFILFYSFTFHSTALVENHTDTNLSHTMLLWIEAVGMIFFTVFFPIMGHVSDIVGRKKVLYYTLVSIFILCFPIYMMILDGGFLLKILGAILLGLFTASLILDS